jgi:hypothetical protein
MGAAAGKALNLLNENVVEAARTRAMIGEGAKMVEAGEALRIGGRVASGSKLAKGRELKLPLALGARRQKRGRESNN